MQQISKTMRIKEKCMTKTKKFTQAGIIFALLVGVGAPVRAQAQAAATSDARQQPVTEEGKFYCNINALTPAERAHQQQLAAKFIAVRMKSSNCRGATNFSSVHRASCSRSWSTGSQPKKSAAHFSIFTSIWKREANCFAWD